jgi:hypothetical protein|tara:strand:- start:241 stop:1128 length:888 start_codon:yes stop_codon:yes gene_type:complete
MEVLLLIGIVEVLNDDEVKKVEQGVNDCVHLWKGRENWHPVNDVPEYNEDVESFMHYSTLGATLYMDASDMGWAYYEKHKSITNRVLHTKFDWVYDKLLKALAPEIGECTLEPDLALPGFHIYQFDDAPDPRKHHRCLHLDGQWFYALKFLKDKYGKDIDIKNPLSFTFTITRPTRGSAIGFWGLPEALRPHAEDLQKKYPHDIIERYENLEYVKEIRKQHAIERPWKYKLFKADCGPLEQYVPKIIPHTPGNSFFYSGYHMHQMILGDSFKKGDTRITLQGHGIRINGQYKLFW